MSDGASQTDLMTQNLGLKSEEKPKIEYDYPEGLDFTPGSTLHDNTLNKLKEMITLSYNSMSERRVKWRELDRILTSFVPEEETAPVEGEETQKTKKSVIVPISYAILETMLAQMVATFLELPYFRYKGVGPEDTIGSILLDHCTLILAFLGTK